MLLQVFSTEEEDALVDYVKKCSDHYYGLSIVELRQLAYQLAKKIQVNYPPKWNANEMSGRDWYYGFMQRHQELTLRTPEHTSLNRTKSFCKENVQAFFRNLNLILTQHPFSAKDIWNMDETGFSTVPTKIGKVISLRGARRVGQMASQERGTTVTMAMSVNAEGNSISPFFLFPRQNMQSTFLEQASPGAIGYANGSGWMQQTEFVKYIRFFIDSTKASKLTPKLLLLDNHASHLSIEALDLAVEHGITFLSFPPHCSHRMQPLDVSVYGPLKTYYKSQCNAWQKNHAGQRLEIRHIPNLVRLALDLALTPHNIKAGFLATGIAPYNSDIFTDSDFVHTVSKGENNRAVKESEANHGEMQRRITFLNIPHVIVQEEVKGCSEPIPSSSYAENLSSVLTSLGPLNTTTSVAKSNRGRRPMASAILTSLENINQLRDRQQKRVSRNSLRAGPSNTAKSDKTLKAPAKRKKSSSSEYDKDFCLICLETMPCRLTAFNSVACIECKSYVHLKCANMSTSYFICRNCDSE